MGEAFSLEKYRQQEMDFMLQAARIGNVLIPVYSEDVAMAFHIRHRVLKGLIESSYYQLCTTYGRKVHRVHHKRSSSCRAMSGYILPFQAMMQVLYQAKIPQMCQAELLHVALCSGCLMNSLN